MRRSCVFRRQACPSQIYGGAETLYDCSGDADLARGGERFCDLPAFEDGMALDGGYGGDVEGAD